MLSLGIAQIHPQKVAGKERALVTAGAGADFEDDVAPVVRIARHQELFEHRAFFGEPLVRGSRFVVREVAHLGIGAQLLGGLEVAAGLSPGDEMLDHVGQLGMLAVEAAVFGDIAGGLFGREQGRDLGQPLFESRQLVEHRGVHGHVRQRPAGRSAPARPSGR